MCCLKYTVATTLCLIHRNNHHTMLYLPKKTQYCVYLIELNTRFVILIQLLEGKEILHYHIIVGMIINKAQYCCYLIEQNTIVIYSY